MLNLSLRFSRTCPKAPLRRCARRVATPSLGGWLARRADQVANSLAAENNNYVGCSSFYPGDDGSFKARKAQFSACHFLMLDDLGTKVPLDRLGGFELSWLIETSPGNHQGGIILAEPLADGAAAVRLLNAVIDVGSVRCGSDWAIEPMGTAAGGNQRQTKICRRIRRTVSVSPDRMAT